VEIIILIKLVGVAFLAHKKLLEAGIIMTDILKHHACLLATI